jgi:hypothetical protein
MSPLFLIAGKVGKIFFQRKMTCVTPLIRAEMFRVQKGTTALLLSSNKTPKNSVILFLNIICLKFKICFSYLFIAIILFSLLKLHFMFVSTFAIPSDWIFSFEL